MGLAWGVALISVVGVISWSLSVECQRFPSSGLGNRLDFYLLKLEVAWGRGDDFNQERPNDLINSLYFVENPLLLSLSRLQIVSLNDKASFCITWVSFAGAVYVGF